MHSYARPPKLMSERWRGERYVLLTKKNNAKKDSSLSNDGGGGTW
jgi:hypothetical protein